MLRQITLIRFKPQVSAEQIDTIGQGFAGLVDIVPGLHRFEFGPDIELEEGTMDYALVIDFEDAATWQAYRDHPLHVAFAQNAMRLIAEVRRSQYLVD